VADVVPLRQQPPGSFDLDAEAAVISTIVLDASKYDEVIGIAPPDMFYSDANRRIYEALVALRESGKPIDVVTLARTLQDSGRLAQVGGTPYLAQLVDATPAVLHVSEHAAIIREKWRLRQALARAQTIVATIRAGQIPSADVQALLEEAELTFAELAHQQQTKHLVVLKSSLDETLQSLKLMSQRGATITGIPMGLKPLDEAMSGLHEGDLYIVAGRPGTGKTAFAMGLGENIAKQGDGVAVFSLEMPDTQLVTRMLSSHTRISLSTFRAPNKIGSHWSTIVSAVGAMEKLPIWIDDTGGISLMEIRARVRKLKTDIANGHVGNTVCSGLKLVIVDYLQLVQAHRERGQNREQEVALVSRSLKLLAKQEKVAVIALSQLNRSSETRKGSDKRPQLSDLRESGAIEQDADAVLFVFRPSMYADDPALEGWAEIIIGKQRNGPVGIHKLAFAKECVRFDLLARGEFDEYDGFQDNM
jgi:replicative DNA helicase